MQNFLNESIVKYKEGKVTFAMNTLLLPPTVSSFLQKQDKMHLPHVAVANMFQSHFIYCFWQLPPHKYESICASLHNSTHLLLYYKLFELQINTKFKN